MLVGAALAGCAEEPPNLEVASDGPTKPMHAARLGVTINETDTASPDLFEDPACEPMADDGPCALVCDPEALLQRYVPEDTCVHFLCTARDGTHHNLGACR